jgi:glutaredoxin-like protein NrdH
MNITLYSKPGCPQCKVLKIKIDKTGIEYKHIEDEDAIIALGAKAAPVLMADDSIHTGPEAIKWFTQWAKENVNGH